MAFVTKRTNIDLTEVAVPFDVLPNGLVKRRKLIVYHSKADMKHMHTCMSYGYPNHPGPCIGLSLLAQVERTHVHMIPFMPTFPGAKRPTFTPRFGLQHGYFHHHPLRYKGQGRTAFPVTNLHRLPDSLLGVCTAQAANSGPKPFRGVYFFVHKANFAACLKSIRDGFVRREDPVYCDMLLTGQLSGPNTTLTGVLNPAFCVALRARCDVFVAYTSQWTTHLMPRYICSHCFSLPNDDGRYNWDGRVHCTCPVEVHLTDDPIRQFVRRLDVLQNLTKFRMRYYALTVHPRVLHNVISRRMWTRATCDDAYRIDGKSPVIPDRVIEHLVAFDQDHGL